MTLSNRIHSTMVCNREINLWTRPVSNFDSLIVAEKTKETVCMNCGDIFLILGWGAGGGGGKR